MTACSRRRFLEAALGTTAMSVAWPAGSRDATPALAAQSLAEGLWLLTGAGANVVAANGPDGALLVDGGSARHSASLLRLALRTTGAKRVDTLFNTHWHPEQTGSNERVGKSGAKIVAHENTKLWLGRRIEVLWRTAPYGPLPPKARPNETIYTSAQRALGNEQIEYGYLAQAHTDGDIYVHFRNANVIAAGGVVSAGAWPILDWQTGGWIGGLVAGLDKLIDLADDKTRIVPADGLPLTRTELQAQRAMFFTLYDRLVKSLVKGLGPEEVVASAPAREFEAQWGDSKQFVTAAFESLWGHFAPDA